MDSMEATLINIFPISTLILFRYKERQTLTPKKPFFLYYAPGDTHAPHQVPEEYIKRYTGKFDQGWDEIRLETLKRQIDMGVCPKNTKLSDRPSNIPAWKDNKEEEKEMFSRMMEVYCAFLEFTDYNIGRVLDYVEEIGIKENTLVVYIQGDNGGSAEGSLRGTTNEAATLGNNLYENNGGTGPSSFSLRMISGLHCIATTCLSDGHGHSNRPCNGQNDMRAISVGQEMVW